MKIFDSHFHIIDSRYHLQENNGYKPDIFTYSDYEALTKKMGLEVESGVIIAGSFQGWDFEYLDILEEIKNYNGKEFFSVVNIKTNVSDEFILNLAKKGVVGVRFNIFRGNDTPVEDIIAFGKRVYELVGWTVEIQANFEILEKFQERLLSIPKLSIDHLGLRKENKSKLIEIAKEGVKIKCSGFGRLDFNPSNFIKELYEINPSCLMFGTDMPSTRVDPLKKFSRNDIFLMESIFTKEELQLVLYENAKNWYKNE